jgi:hypothetical protein
MQKLFVECLRILRCITLVATVVMLMLGASVKSGRADLRFQSDMEARCRPASPTTQSILGWKRPDTCGNDCFVWRLVCSNGRHYDLQSKVSPATTQAQMTFYEWAPWSFLLYLLPFLVYFGLAAIGAQWLELLLVLDGLVLTYATTAAWCFYAAVTGNPRGSTVWVEQALFLNPYIYFSVIGLVVLLNLPAAWHGFETLFYRHRPEIVGLPATWPGYRPHTAAMSAALMPSLYEFIDPRETASHYRRETDRVRALREKFDAEAALAGAIIRRERWRNQFNDQTGRSV